MEVILVVTISHMAIMHNLLHKTHFRGRHVLYIKIAIYHLLEKIYIT